MRSDWNENLFKLTVQIIRETVPNSFDEFMNMHYASQDILHVVQATCVFIMSKTATQRTTALSALCRKTIRWMEVNEINISEFIEELESDIHVPESIEWELIAEILGVAYEGGWLDTKYIPDSLGEYEEQGADERRAFSRYSGNDPITRVTGLVYFIKDTEVSGLVKIGFTTNWKSRSFAFDTKLPFKWELVHIVYCTDHRFAEKLFHLMFEHKRMNGEWFDLSEDDLRFVKSGAYFKSAELKRSYKLK